LIRFLDEGRIEIDGNVVDRSIGPIAPNRKNAPFAGSDGGEHWATVASIIETNHAYIADVITRIVNRHPNNQVDDLLPGAYPAEPILKAMT
jgi:transposase